jgi:uncharacterized DUF497 family protein
MNKQLILSAARKMEDPYADLYYELDMENGGVGNVLCETFEWDRAKSNANVREKGFSFYLARNVFLDDAHTIYGPDRVVNGERRVKVIGCPFGLLDAGLLVVINVALNKADMYHRIISAWENEDPLVEKAYKKRLRWVIESRAALRKSFNKMVREVEEETSPGSDPLWRFRIPRDKGKS